MDKYRNIIKLKYKNFEFDNKLKSKEKNMSNLIKNILSQEYYQDASAMQLVEFLEETNYNLEGSVLYYQFPIIREFDDGLYYPTFMLVSPMYGVILFLVDSVSRDRNSDLEKLSEKILRIEELIFSRLIKSSNKKLKSGRRNLSFNLSSALFLPNLESDNYEDIEACIIKNHMDLNGFLDEAREQQLDEEVMNEIFSILDSSSAIIKPKERVIEGEEIISKAHILRKLEEEIAVFDSQQKYAALSQLNGPQRIRGLAGSGKTIILCMKAALLHLKYPEKNILYTFMTKSLYDYIELLITRFYKVLGDGNLPDFGNKIHVLHAWGGENVKGVYYSTCKKNDVEPIAFSEAAKSVGRGDAFNYICEQLLEATSGTLNKEYDYVLIDEGQDFKPSFYQICRAIVQNDCLVWGYDDLQNIFDVKMQNTMDTFKNKFGAKGINLAELQKQHLEMDNDIVLHRSYRNPKEILVTAHALGFGIYSDILVQTLENKEHWEDVGYKVNNDEIVAGELIEIERPLSNSPLSVSRYCTSDEIIQYYSASNFDDEVGWIANEIESSIKNDGLRPDDIIVISLDDRHSKGYFNALAALLYSKGIYTNNLSANYYVKGFTEDEKVTLSTVYKAKGHEAAMVFVIGCDVFEAKKNDRVMRNKLFTGLTRAKAWLRISGLEIEEGSLITEFKKVVESGFKLRFIHKEAYVINRDLQEAHIKKAKFRQEINNFIIMLKEAGYTDKEIDTQLNQFIKDSEDKYE
ncbi:hypothetical protein C3943_08465 [Lysinibacillus sp. B2A1]|nr:hypothetical protein C3943_08465 [Lysinibacillus sp. B2A1]